MRELVKTYKSLCEELFCVKKPLDRSCACSEEGFHLYSRTAKKGSSRKPSFRQTGFSETQLAYARIPIRYRGVQVGAYNP